MGVAGNCQRFDLAESGEFCGVESMRIAERYGVMAILGAIEDGVY